MSFYSTIRRQCYSFSYGRKIRSQRSILSLGIILFICIFLIIRRKETCRRKYVFFSFFIKNNDFNLVDYYRSRLFCFVLTSQGNLESRARAVYETWGHRCGRFVFITRLNSSKSYTIFDNEKNFLEKNELPIQYIPTLPNENYSNLPDKTRASLLFFNEYYPNYDWYLKADDDTYIILENLLRFLVSTIK